MQYITWLIPSTEQMSDVQMCTRVLLLLAVRAVGEVSLCLYLYVRASGCLCMHVGSWIMYFTMFFVLNITSLHPECGSIPEGVLEQEMQM